MATSQNLQTLVINRIPNQEIYDNLISTGRVNENELYLIEGDTEASIIDVQINGVSIVNNKIANITLTKADIGLGNVDNTSDVNKPISTATQTALNTKVPTSRTINGKALTSNITLNAADVGAIDSSLKGTANGVAELDSSGKVPAAQLPSYVDDVLEYTSKSNFPTAGESDKIYVDTSTNLIYRWSGTTYVEISSSLALGNTSSTAFRGDYGEAAYTHAVTNKGKAFSSGLYKITTNEEGHVTTTVAVQKSDITALGIPAQDTTYNAATTTAMGLMSAEDKAKLNNIEANANNYTLPTASTTLGGVKTTSNVSSSTGYTSCPIINGVVYYKDTNTTYNVVTPSIDGLMSAADKTKLDSLRVTSQVTVSEIEPSNMIEGDIWMVIEQNSNETTNQGTEN